MGERYHYKIYHFLQPFCENQYDKEKNNWNASALQTKIEFYLIFICLHNWVNCVSDNTRITEKSVGSSCSKDSSLKSMLLFQCQSARIQQCQSWCFSARTTTYDLYSHYIMGNRLQRQRLKVLRLRYWLNCSIETKVFEQIEEWLEGGMTVRWGGLNEVVRSGCSYIRRWWAALIVSCSVLGTMF